MNNINYNYSQKRHGSAISKVQPSSHDQSYHSLPPKKEGKRGTVCQAGAERAPVLASQSSRISKGKADELSTETPTKASGTINKRCVVVDAYGGQRAESERELANQPHCSRSVGSCENLEMRNLRGHKLRSNRIVLPAWVFAADRFAMQEFDGQHLLKEHHITPSRRTKAGRFPAEVCSSSVTSCPPPPIIREV